MQRRPGLWMLKVQSRRGQRCQRTDAGAQVAVLVAGDVGSARPVGCGWGMLAVLRVAVVVSPSGPAVLVNRRSRREGICGCKHDAAMMAGYDRSAGLRQTKHRRGHRAPNRQQGHEQQQQPEAQGSHVLSL
jgi:hypothetical protein